MAKHLLAVAAITVALAASSAYANHCNEPGAGRACYDAWEVPPNVGTYIGVFRHAAGSNCPFVEGSPESFLLDNGTITSNNWRIHGILTAAGTFKLPNNAGHYDVSGRVGGGEARAVYTARGCRGDFYWKKIE